MNYAAYNSVPWSIRNTYCLDISTFLTYKAGKRFPDHKVSDSIKILKLHGSLNWWYTVRSSDDPRNAIRAPGNKLMCVNAPILRRVVRYFDEKKSRFKHAVPLVVPPIYEKASRFFRPLRSIWTAAAQEISQANRIVVFGYSFPETDFAARSLFRKGFHANKRLNRVDVIDPNPDVAAKASSLTGARTTRHYRDVRAFVDDE